VIKPQSRPQFVACGVSLSNAAATAYRVLETKTTVR